MEARVGSSPEAYWLVFVLQVILYMPHLMVHSKELLHSYCGTLLNPVIEKGDTTLIKYHLS